MVFTPKNDTATKEKLVGFHVSASTHSQIKLLSVEREVFMATIMAGLVCEYLKTQPSETELIEILAKKAHKEWDSTCYKMKNKRGWKTGRQLGIKWNLFIEKARHNLKLRKIDKDTIDLIIEELEELEINR